MLVLMGGLLDKSKSDGSTMHILYKMKIFGVSIHNSNDAHKSQI